MIARVRYRRGVLLSLDEKTSCFELEVFDGMHDVYRSPHKNGFDFERCFVNI